LRREKLRPRRFFKSLPLADSSADVELPLAQFLIVALFSAGVGIYTGPSLAARVNSWPRVKPPSKAVQ
jgi:hypothetical protein